MSTKTMTFRESSGVLLCAHASDPPAPEEWAAYVAYCVRLPRTCNKALVLTDGGGPNAAQRKMLQDRFLSTHTEYLVAVMTDSAMVRGIVTALNWFNPHTQSFAYDEGRGVVSALAHLRIEAAAVPQIRLELEIMRRDLRAP